MLSRITRRTRKALAGVAAGSLAVGLFALPASARQPKDGPSSPVLSVSQTSLAANGQAAVQVTGTDYLLPDHVDGGSVFGGVYVLFGWVRPGGGWGPSFRNSNNNDGTFATTYAYPGDNGGVDTRDDGSGVIRLVSFTAEGASGDSTGFHMDGAGNWSVPFVINGSTFTYKNTVTGVQMNVDCQAVQCGVFTIGAHGKSSRTNEQFVPIKFVGAPPPPSNTQPPTRNPAGATNPGAQTPTPPSGSGAANPGTTSVPGSLEPSEGDPGVTETAPTTTVDVEAAANQAQRALDATLAASDRASATEVPVGPIVGIAVGLVILVGGAGFFWWRRARRVAPSPGKVS